MAPMELNTIAARGGPEDHPRALGPSIAATATPDHDDSIASTADDIGNKSEIKYLYEGPQKCRCCINWVAEEPVELKEYLEHSAENRLCALLVRLKKSHKDDKPLVLHSIVVHSTHLKELLCEVFQGYDGITPTLQKLVFTAPFHPFYHRWTLFKHLCLNQNDPKKKADALLLYKVVFEELEEALTTSQDLTANRVITYDYLWTIFPTGCDVVQPNGDRTHVYRLDAVSYGILCEVPCFILEVRYIDCNGEEYGWRKKNLGIPIFKGTMSIDQLDAVPQDLYPSYDKLRADLTARGKVHRQMHEQSYHYAQYQGDAKSYVDKTKFRATGRIVVDPMAYYTFNKKEPLQPLSSYSGVHKVDITDPKHDERLVIPAAGQTSHGRGSRIIRPSTGQVNLAGESSLLPRSGEEEETAAVSDELLYLCTPEVRGYSLATKKWGCFDIALISEVQLNVDAFRHLVLAEHYKRLIVTFVESRSRNRDTFDDIIEGKGRGIIMLLEGSPGVGKTLTAEAIADKLRRPIYSISGGELGGDASTIEQSLRPVLEVAARWDAVLLLDECDVFLQKRSMKDLGRNSVVAVFLRLLEYYQGILFMTTNRVETIDPAFRSRIHLTIKYPNLNTAARKQIFKTFVTTTSAGSTITEEDFSILAQEKFNGREIKNLVRISQLLASHEKQSLNIDHVKTVLRALKGESEVNEENGSDGERSWTNIN